jgi:hypothetical protein
VCYRLHALAVARGEATWEDLAARGLALPLAAGRRHDLQPYRERLGRKKEDDEERRRRSHGES